MLGWGAAVNGQPAPPPSCRPTLAFTQLHPHNPLFVGPSVPLVLTGCQVSSGVVDGCQMLRLGVLIAAHGRGGVCGHSRRMPWSVSLVSLGITSPQTPHCHY